jgi:hypothetical protein
MSSSRLALPFLRPLLPLTPLQDDSSSFSSSSSSSASSSSIDLLLILENIHSLKYSKPSEFVADLGLLKQEIIQRLYHWIQHFEGKNESVESDPAPSFSVAAAAGGVVGSVPVWNISEKNMEIIVSHHSLTKIIYNSFETISESAKNYLLNKDLLFQEIEEEKRKRMIESIQQQQQQKVAEVMSGGRGAGGGGKKKGRKPNVVSKSPLASSMTSVLTTSVLPPSSSSSSVVVLKEETVTTKALTTRKSSAVIAAGSIYNDNDSVVTSSQLLVEERGFVEDEDVDAAVVDDEDTMITEGNQDEMETSSSLETEVLVNGVKTEVNNKMEEVEEEEIDTSKRKNDDGGEGEEESKEIQRKEEQLLEKLWRMYCHRDPILSKMKLVTSSSSSSESNDKQEQQQQPSFSFSSDDKKLLSSGMSLSSFTTLYYSNNASSSSSSANLVNPRSFRSWNDYLKEGIMPTEYITYSLTGGGKAGKTASSASTGSSSIPSLLQIRNQLLLNDVTAFTKGPEETNETSRFNIFDSKHSKKILKEFLFFNEMDNSLSLEERKRQQQQQQRNERNGEMEGEKESLLEGDNERMSGVNNVQEEINEDTQYLVHLLLSLCSVVFKSFLSSRLSSSLLVLLCSSLLFSLFLS